jgi:hypothetical protein
MVGTLVDLNEYMSKGELTTFITEQHNLMNELTRKVNNLVTCIEQIEQHPLPHCSDDEDADVFYDEDANADNDAHNHHHYNFNRRGMRGNNHGNNDLFAKIKFSLLFLLVMLILRHT